MLQVRVPAEILAALDKRVVEQKVTRSAVVREALASFLADPAVARATVREVLAKPAPLSRGVERLIRPEARKPSPDVALAVVSGDRCPRCGALYSLVGHSHRCGT